MDHPGIQYARERRQHGPIYCVRHPISSFLLVVGFPENPGHQSFGAVPDKLTPPSILYLYSNAVPMASTLASAIEILLFQLGYLSPIASIIWSIIAIGAWLYSFMTWMVCEMADYGCVIPLYRFQYEYGPLERPTGTGPGLWECRLIFTMAVVAGYFVYLGFAGRAIDVQRKEEKMRRAVMAKEWVELGEGGRKV